MSMCLDMRCIRYRQTYLSMFGAALRLLANFMDFKRRF